MTHLWSARGKAQKGIPAIDSRLHYLNHYDTFGDIIGLYNSRICNAEQAVMMWPELFSLSGTTGT
jgi:hypothetical protein